MRSFINHASTSLQHLPTVAATNFLLGELFPSQAWMLYRSRDTVCRQILRDADPWMLDTSAWAESKNLSSSRKFKLFLINYISRAFLRKCFLRSRHQIKSRRCSRHWGEVTLTPPSPKSLIQMKPQSHIRTCVETSVRSDSVTLESVPTPWSSNINACRDRKGSNKDPHCVWGRNRQRDLCFRSGGAASVTEASIKSLLSHAFLSSYPNVKYVFCTH